MVSHLPSLAVSWRHCLYRPMLLARHCDFCLLQAFTELLSSDPLNLFIFILLAVLSSPAWSSLLHCSFFLLLPWGPFKRYPSLHFFFYYSIFHWFCSTLVSPCIAEERYCEHHGVSIPQKIFSFLVHFSVPWPISLFFFSLKLTWPLSLQFFAISEFPLKPPAPFLSPLPSIFCQRNCQAF